MIVYPIIADAIIFNKDITYNNKLYTKSILLLFDRFKLFYFIIYAAFLKIIN